MPRFLGAEQEYQSLEKHQTSATKMGAGCTKDAKGGVVDLQNGNGPETPRSPAKAVVKTEGRTENHFE